MFAATSRRIRSTARKLLPRYYRSDFLERLPPKAVVLDVGCGNDSPRDVKSERPDIHYVGLDIGDYRHTCPPTENADEFVVVSPGEFASAIAAWSGRFDAVVSSHNIEHCDEPDRVLTAMAGALKPGGRLFLAFPAEASARFPHREGTLNFRDDPTHRAMPEFDRIVGALRSGGLSIDVASRRYRPLKPLISGLFNEAESRRTRTVMPGTWALWGFESIVWASRPTR